MTRKCPTVADLRVLKGCRQLTMLRYSTLDEARAAETALIDIASVPPELVSAPRYREAAPGAFPQERHLVQMDPAELDAFMARIGN